MHAIDIPTAIDTVFTTFESSDAQRADAIAILSKDCAMVGEICVFQPTQTDIADPKAKEWIAKNKPHLLPRQYERSLADRAFADGNLSARALLLAQVGEQEANAVAATYGLRSFTDTRRGKPQDAPAAKVNGKDVSHASNPFHKSNWNVSKQGALVRSLGEEKARAIARSVGVDLGATRPNPNF